MSGPFEKRKMKWKEKIAGSNSRDASFETVSGDGLEPLYTPDDINIDYMKDLGFPGEYPYTRGVYDTMYRGRLWTMRMFSGFGSAEDTNRRYKYLLEHGQTGLSVAFDFPTLYGRDSDESISLGEVGKAVVVEHTNFTK